MAKTVIVDPVSPARAWVRRLAVLGRVARRTRESAPSRHEFVDRTIALRDAALAARTLGEKVTRLWTVESLAFCYCEHTACRLSLADHGLPPEAGPPAHCGLGMAAVLTLGFDPEKIARLIDDAADPTYIRFSYESLGVMMAAWERDAFGWVTDILGRLGVVRRVPLRCPNNSDFLDGLPRERRRLVAHGYGRMLYLKSQFSASAVAKGLRLHALAAEACIRGISGAYALVNCADLPGALRLGEGLEESTLSRGIDGGLVNTLTLLEWSFPGLLANMETDTARTAEFVRLAGEQARNALAAGLAPPLIA